MRPGSSEDWRVWLMNQLFLTTCMFLFSTSFFQLFPCLLSRLAGDRRVLEQMGSFAIYLVGCAPLQGTEQHLAKATAVTWAPFSHITLDVGLRCMSK